MLMQVILNTINELLDRMGYTDANIKAEDNMGRIKVDIKLREAKELIGEKGATLAIFEHISRKIVSRRVMPAPKIDIDINNYRQMREGVLRDFALDIGERVRAGKRALELDPMSSFDRRIVHLALQNFTDVTTESVGEGDSRYIVVKPVKAA